jgi:hypothetical protein
MPAVKESKPNCALGWSTFSRNWNDFCVLRLAMSEHLWIFSST